MHFCDLGGNTEIVFQQKALADRADAKGVTVVPDCGLAPGMVNILAEYGIRQLDKVDSVRIFVGGLPQDPEPPLNYQIVYSLEGVLDYYTTLSWVLRDGKRTQVTALSEREPVEFPEPVGDARGVSHRGRPLHDGVPLRGQDPEMEYKTLRYPGHAEIMETIRELGLLDLEPVDVKGSKVVAARRCSSPSSGRSSPSRRARTSSRCASSSTARRTASRRSVAFDLVDRYDEQHGISAMMRTTGYSLSITGQMQARGEVGPPGVWTPDECMPAEAYIAELRARGIELRRPERESR